MRRKSQQLLTRYHQIKICLGKDHHPSFLRLREGKLMCVGSPAGRSKNQHLNWIQTLSSFLLLHVASSSLGTEGNFREI